MKISMQYVVFILIFIIFSVEYLMTWQMSCWALEPLNVLCPRGH